MPNQPKTRMIPTQTTHAQGHPKLPPALHPPANTHFQPRWQHLVMHRPQALGWRRCSTQSTAHLPAACFLPHTHCKLHPIQCCHIEQPPASCLRPSTAWPWGKRHKPIFTPGNVLPRTSHKGAGQEDSLCLGAEGHHVGHRGLQPGGGPRCATEHRTAGPSSRVHCMGGNLWLEFINPHFSFAKNLWIFKIILI